jgi:hypothetical protein
VKVLSAVVARSLRQSRFTNDQKNQESEKTQQGEQPRDELLEQDRKHQTGDACDNLYFRCPACQLSDPARSRASLE